ncbi:hypothetical protein [Mycolicibacillus trivialis]|uniref:hypothetical protein n=1 Tax=Mycolicibacillus trivialis TaxID=1798 RepID=UPI0013FDBFDB|nr:hypothetical protein [Mycolicibacillus trivialis]
MLMLMDAKDRLRPDVVSGPCGHQHAVHHLRPATAGRHTSEEHRRRIRAATRC